MAEGVNGCESVNNDSFVVCDLRRVEDAVRRGRGEGGSPVGALGAGGGGGVDSVLWNWSIRENVVAMVERNSWVVVDGGAMVRCDNVQSI